MIKCIYKVLLSLTVLTVTANLASAQMQTSPKKYFRGNSITLKLGVTETYTDIRTKDYGWASAGGQSELKPGFGLSINHMFSSVFGVQGNFSYNQILGILDTTGSLVQDKRRFKETGFPGGVYFDSNVLHGGLSAYVNITNLAMGLAKANQKGNHGRRFAVYAAAGVGIANFETTIKDLPGDNISEGVSYAKRDSVTGLGGYLRGNSGPGTVELDFPATLGVKYKLSRRLDLGLEHTTHFVMTDKLDGYVNNTNSFSNFDKFSLSALTVTYKFSGNDENIDYIEWLDPTEVMYDDYQLLSDKLRKLSTDTDNDGVSEIFDKEPNTPAGAVVDGAGRSIDSDGDGVADYKDVDPFTPKGATVDAEGKAVDTDGDGVADALDKEPNTKPGSLVNQEGKTIKQDFATKDDLKNAGGGYVPPTVYFDNNSSTIKSVYYPELAGLAKYLKQNNTGIILYGHTDITGSESSNTRLGQKRADAVKDFLVKTYGIDASRIDVKSEGERKQLFEKNYQVNRRVEIEIKK